MAKKRSENNEDLMSDFFEIIEDDNEIVKVYKMEEEPELTYNNVAYSCSWNDANKTYDLLIININTDSNRTKVVREKTKFSNDFQIHAEILKRINNDFVFKGRKK